MDLQKRAMELSVKVAEAINPVSWKDAPLCILALESYARELRERLPEAGTVADELAAHISYLTVVHERKENAPAGGNRTGRTENNKTI